MIWSGKRDSNSRPRPWQGRALPTELFPQQKGTSFEVVRILQKFWGNATFNSTFFVPLGLSA